MAPTINETAILPDKISYDSNFYFEFLTEVIETGSGVEQRNALWSDYRLSGDLVSPNLTEADLQDIIDLFLICQGRAFGFRVKFWGDYAGTAEVIGTGDDTEDEFQLIKTYTHGAYTFSRDIYKPVSGSVHIYFDTVEQMSGWSVSTSTGLVTFTSPPAGGVVITATYEYHFPMRFDTDKLNIQYKAYQVGQATIPVIEVR